MADADDAAAPAPALRRSGRTKSKVDYAAMERAGSPPPEAPPPKRAKRAAGGASAVAPAAVAPAPVGDDDEDDADDDADELLAGVHGRITLSRATGDEFVLTKAQLAALPYEEAPNPHAKSSALMRLYQHRDVLALALRLHGGRIGLDAARAKRAERSQRAASAAAQRTSDRRSELSAALAAQGLKLRSDSWLCEQYLKHGPTAEWPLAAVVRRMAQMKYLHEHTNYRDILRAIRNDIRECGERWDAVETAEDAEQQALPPGGYPAVWPWLAGPAA